MAYFITMLYQSKNQNVSKLNQLKTQNLSKFEPIRIFSQTYTFYPSSANQRPCLQLFGWFRLPLTFLHLLSLDPSMNAWLSPTAFTFVVLLVHCTVTLTHIVSLRD